MKKRNFNITWAEKSTKSWKVNPTRTTKVEIPNASDDIGIAAKSALQVFSNSFGSLAKVDVINIQEIDADGAAIGEPIVPDTDSSIIPAGK